MDDLLKAIADAASTIWLVVLAAWGGSVNYFTNLKAKFQWKFYLIHISTSAFAGLITVYACTANDVSYPLMAALAGVSGHMGVSAVQLLERKFFGVERRAQGDSNDKQDS